MIHSSHAGVKIEVNIGEDNPDLFRFCFIYSLVSRANLHKKQNLKSIWSEPNTSMFDIVGNTCVYPTIFPLNDCCAKKRTKSKWKAQVITQEVKHEYT